MVLGGLPDGDPFQRHLALELQKQLGLGSYKTAWLLCAKLRRAMVAPGRGPLAGLVEVDETEIVCRSEDVPLTGAAAGAAIRASCRWPARSRPEAGGPGRIRLIAIKDYAAKTLHAVIKDNIAPGATVKTDGWAGYPGAPDVNHEPHIIGPMAAHIVLPWTHRVFSNLKTWAPASTMACAASTSRPISTSSPSASTVAAPATPRSDRSSASALPSNPPPTTC